MYTFVRGCLHVLCMCMQQHACMSICMYILCITDVKHMFETYLCDVFETLVFGLTYEICLSFQHSNIPRKVLDSLHVKKDEVTTLYQCPCLLIQRDC